MTQNDMSELIQRKDVIKAMGEIHPMDYNTISLLERIQQIPAIDASPVKHGRWVQEEDRDNHWRCSNCLVVWGVTHRAFKYCPNCGAKMDLEG